MKYKVCVYAICKNEEEHIISWVNSMKEADEIIVLDTGSTDQSVKLLKEHGVKVYEKEIMPWRFDVARNESLRYVPEDTDICVCTDIDEFFDPGWREKLEKCWHDKTTRVRYTYHWNSDEQGNPIITFYLDKIHSRHDYVWTHPVHEVLTNVHENETYITCDDIVLVHHQTPKESRSNYLPLLELSVKEHPEDDRNMHYLGREYMYYERYEEAILTLKKHLDLKTALWKDERCASMRFIGRCYERLEDIPNAKEWYQKSIEEAPYLREPYVEFGLLYYKENDFENAERLLKASLNIKENPKTYINEPYCYDGTVEDILSVCLFYLGKKEEALGYAMKASLLKKEERILKNIEYMKENLLDI